MEFLEFLEKGFKECFEARNSNGTYRSVARNSTLVDGIEHLAPSMSAFH